VGLGGRCGDLERALALNPSAAHALRMYSYAVLVPLDRMPEAIAAARKATELDPLTATSWGTLWRGALLQWRDGCRA